MSGQRTQGEGRRLRGVMINCAPAQCSIYESGVMFWNALRGSREFDLSYREVHHFTQIPSSGYDFLVFNYHHTTLRWLDTRRLAELPGAKLAFVLEMTATDPFAFCPREDFDAYLVPDPTHRCPDPRVFAVPRPLEATPALPPHEPKPVPWIGSFGFATPGKGFEKVVAAVNDEFERAVVRINIPFATHADASGELARRYSEACRDLARPGVEVRVTHEYLDKEGVIRWCAENTLNVFLYDRNQTGLAATTDQAIVSGRPLAVSRCDTFRHVHEHLAPYPELSLRSALATSEPAVAKMRELWSARAFQQRFAEVLAELGRVREDALDRAETKSGAGTGPLARWSRVLCPEDRHELASEDLASGFVAKALAELHPGQQPARVLRWPEEDVPADEDAFDFVVVDARERPRAETLAFLATARRALRPLGHLVVLWKLAARDSATTWSVRGFEEGVVAALAPYPRIDEPEWDAGRARPDALMRRSCLATFVVRRTHDVAMEARA